MNNWKPYENIRREEKKIWLWLIVQSSTEPKFKNIIYVMPKMKFSLNVFGTYLPENEKIGENKPRQWKASQKNRFVLNRSQLQKTEETVGKIRRSESRPGHRPPPLLLFLFLRSLVYPLYHRASVSFLAFPFSPATVTAPPPAQFKSWPGGPTFDTRGE